MKPFSTFIRSLGWCAGGYAIGALLFWCGYAAYYGGSWSIWLMSLFWLSVVSFWSIAVSLLRLWRPQWIGIPSLLAFGVAIALLPLLGFWPTYFFRIDFALFIFAADAIFLAMILLLVYWISRVATNRSNQSMKPTPKEFASKLAPPRKKFRAFATTPAMAYCGYFFKIAGCRHFFDS